MLKQKIFPQYLMKMKEDSEKERLEQLEQEEFEKSKRLPRRSSSPGVRHSQPDAAERSAHSEPIPRITQFVSSSIKNIFFHYALFSDPSL